MPILNGTPYSDGQLLDILGEFPRAFELMKSRGIPCDSSKIVSGGPRAHTQDAAPFPPLSNVDGRARFDWLEIPNGRLTSKPVLHREVFKDVEFIYPVCLELVVAASLSDDQAFVDAYLAREDLHQRTADRLGVSRDQAKRINFSAALGREFDGVSLSQAWPEVFAARNRFLEQVESDGIVRTLFSRRAFTRAMCREADFRRKAWAHYVLGTAADLMKIGLVLAYRRGIPVCGVFVDEFVVEAGWGNAMREEVLSQLPIRFLNSPVTIAGPKTALSRICGEDDVI